MTRDEALKRLRPCEAELRASGLAALYLFGSTARDEAGQNSDLDLLFELGDVPKFSLLDQCAIQVRLEELLNINVDLIERAALRPRIKARVEPEMVRVF